MKLCIDRHIQWFPASESLGHMEEMMPRERGDTLLTLHGAQCVPGAELSLLHTFLFNVFPTPTRPEALRTKPPPDRKLLSTEPPLDRKLLSTEPLLDRKPLSTEPPPDRKCLSTKPPPDRKLLSMETLLGHFTACAQSRTCDRCPTRVWRSELYSLSTCPVRPSRGRGERCDGSPQIHCGACACLSWAAWAAGSRRAGSRQTFPPCGRRGGWCQHLGCEGLKPPA